MIAQAIAQGVTGIRYDGTGACAPVTPTATPVTPTATPVTPTATPVTPTATPVTPTATPVDPDRDTANRDIDSDGHANGNTRHADGDANHSHLRLWNCHDRWHHTQLPLRSSQWRRDLVICLRRPDSASGSGCLWLVPGPLPDDAHGPGWIRFGPVHPTGNHTNGNADRNASHTDGNASHADRDIDPATVTPTATATPITPTATPGTSFGTVTGTNGDNLNCRNAPISGAVIAKLAPGSQVAVRGPVSNGWYPVRCANQDGWVSAQYLTVGGNPTPTVTPTSYTGHHLRHRYRHRRRDPQLPHCPGLGGGDHPAQSGRPGRAAWAGLQWLVPGALRRTERLRFCAIPDCQR